MRVLSDTRTERPMKQPTEARRLLRALAKGDLQALGHLYDAHAPRVYHLLLARGLDEPAAEDVLQDVFLGLLDRGAAVAKIDNMQAYLLSIARNMASRRPSRCPISRTRQCCTIGFSSCSGRLPRLYGWRARGEDYQRRTLP